MARPLPCCGARVSWILLSCWTIANTCWTPCARCLRPFFQPSRRPCGWLPPAENCSECRANTPGRLQPLDCSRPDSPAQQFFRRRADAARPGAVTGADQDAITAIVRRLDGLPLAIELAAAQVATLGIADLAEQIEASVGARLGGLSRRGGEPRHRTLRAAIEWSERLLPTTPRKRWHSGPSSPVPSAEATRRRCCKSHPT